MSWTEIIGQIDAEIARLQRARDVLASAPSGLNLASSTKALASNTKARKPVKPAPAKIAKKRKQAKKVAVPVVSDLESREPAASIAPQPTEAPQVQRVPPKRRIERRQPQRAARSEQAAQPAALSGSVPSGPIVVSADEARKAQERAAAPPSNGVPIETPSAPGSERSLGDLVRAFERSNRMSGLGNL